MDFLGHVDGATDCSGEVLDKYAADSRLYYCGDTGCSWPFFDSECFLDLAYPAFYAACLLSGFIRRLRDQGSEINTGT